MEQGTRRANDEGVHHASFILASSNGTKSLRSIAKPGLSVRASIFPSKHLSWIGSSRSSAVQPDKQCPLCLAGSCIFLRTPVPSVL
jgi:hypothetical protein